MLSGDNGILQKATEAKTNTERASIIEQARTDILGQIAENKGKNISKDQLKSILNIYFVENEVNTLNIPDDTSTSNDELTSKEGNYKIKLSEIYSGTFKSSESNQIGIRVHNRDLLFTNLYEKNEENQLISQLIATGSVNFMSNDGESVPTFEEVKNFIENRVEDSGYEIFEETLNIYLICFNVIPVVITQSVNGETTTITNDSQQINLVGAVGDENDYTIKITSNTGKSGETTFTLTTRSSRSSRSIWSSWSYRRSSIVLIQLIKKLYE